MFFNQVLQGDCLKRLKDIPDEIIDCCVTSPPYYGLRDYGTWRWEGGDPKCPHKRLSKFSEKTITGHHQEELIGMVSDAIYKKVCPLCGAVRIDEQIGLEETPEEYIERLVNVFREVRRVLKKDGTLWVNIGDSYAGSGKGRNADGTSAVDDNSKQATSKGTTEGLLPKSVSGDAKPKDLIGIPWMLAFALRNDGWYLRQDIIWHKPNPMPESVTDRCTKSHEYIFLLSKSPKYYFDYESIQENADPKWKSRYKSEFNNGKVQKTPYPNGGKQTAGMKTYTGKRNKRDVWKVTVKAVKEAHFATFPEDLIKPCILAGCRKGGVVLDPFFGSGTTGRVATMLNREYLGIELNPEYIEISKRRTNNVQLSMIGMI